MGIVLRVTLLFPFRQFVVNCRTGKADESLSFWFLLLWFFSDLANFVGTILSRQLIVLVSGSSVYGNWNDRWPFI